MDVWRVRGHHEVRPGCSMFLSHPNCLLTTLSTVHPTGPSPTSTTLPTRSLSRLKPSSPAESGQTSSGLARCLVRAHLLHPTVTFTRKLPPDSFAFSLLPHRITADNVKNRSAHLHLVSPDPPPPPVPLRTLTPYLWPSATQDHDRLAHLPPLHRSLLRRPCDLGRGWMEGVLPRLRASRAEGVPDKVSPGSTLRVRCQKETREIC